MRERLHFQLCVVRPGHAVPVSSKPILRTAAIFLAVVCQLVMGVTAYSAPVQWTVEEGGNGHWYEAVLVPADPVDGDYISWSDANSLAVNAGGYLATVHSQAEQNFIFALVYLKPGYWYNDKWGNGMGPWLGALRIIGTNTFRWVNGEPWTYSNWAPGEPNNDGGHGGENCMHLFS